LSKFQVVTALTGPPVEDQCRLASVPPQWYTNMLFTRTTCLQSPPFALALSGLCRQGSLHCERFYTTWWAINSRYFSPQLVLVECGTIAACAYIRMQDFTCIVYCIWS
jgi:hypothetical protein